MNILSRKIKDSRFLNIIRAFLKTGYLEDWTYNSTYSGTPQGGICSPILANIYLSELDKKVREISKRMEDLNKTARPTVNRDYSRIQGKCTNLSKKIRSMPEGKEKEEALKQLFSTKKKLFALPYTNYTDKGLKYVRYADDWLIGIKGSKADCFAIKKEIKDFLFMELKLELSDEKTLITHSANKVRFLGYDIMVRRNRSIRGYRDKSGKWRKRRALNRKVALLVPMQDRIMSFMFRKKAIRQKQDGRISAVHRNDLFNKPEVEIVKSYNSEIRGLLNYYGLADNYRGLSYFVFLMEYSCLKTLACKHKCSVKKILNKYRNGHGWSIPYGSIKNPTRIGIIDFKDYFPKLYSDEIREYHFYGYKSQLWKRIQHGVCELCNTKSERKPVVHVVRKLKELGNQPWELAMKKKRRKTLIVCPACHNLIHAFG